MPLFGSPSTWVTFGPLEQHPDGKIFTPVPIVRAVSGSENRTKSFSFLSTSLLLNTGSFVISQSPGPGLSGWSERYRKQQYLF